MRSLLGPLLNKAPVPFASYNGDRAYAARGRGRVSAEAQMEAMGASAALFSIISRTSTATAKEQWHMHKRSPGSSCTYHAGQDDECGAQDVVMVPKHPALTVINKPNRFLSRTSMFESGQQYVDLTGEGWLIVGRIGKLPAELWVARPDRMIVVTDPAEFLLGYIYCSPDGREIPLRIDQVLSMRMPAPLDAYRGIGPVQTIMAQVTGAQYSAEWNANFFRNGARPGGVVRLSRRMNDKEFNRLVERFNIAHQGAANAGRTAFLEEGDWVDVKPMSLADMQFVETANLNRDTILLAFGASKFDVGVLEDVNRAASGSARADFGERMTIPRLDRWHGMFNNQFLPMFGATLGNPDVYEIVYSSPVPADRQQNRDDKVVAANVYATLVGARVSSVDAAKVAGLPPMEVEPEPAPVIMPSPASAQDPDVEPVPA